METSLETKSTETLNQKIKLINGNFTSSEAKDILNGLLDIKINFHKLQRLSRTEGNMNDSCEFDTGRIIELIDSKQNLKPFLTDVRINGKKLKIESTITITVED